MNTENLDGKLLNYIQINQVVEVFPLLSKIVRAVPSVLAKEEVKRRFVSLQKEFNLYKKSLQNIKPNDCLAKNLFINNQLTYLSDALLKYLETTPKTTKNGVTLKDNKTHFKELMGILKENGENNSVALWTRYCWDSQIMKILRGQEYFPSALEIDLSTKCNDRCYFCQWQKLYQKNKVFFEFPFEKLIETLEDFSKIPETGLLIASGGGEPTCYSRFEDAVRAIKKYGFDLYISTNGGLIGTKKLPAELFWETPTTLKFSIGGATHETYNYIHFNKNKNAVEKGDVMSLDFILKQISIISKSRKKKKYLGVPIAIPRLVIAYTISTDNQDEVLLMAKKAYEAGVDVMCFRPVMLFGQTRENCRTGLEQMVKAKETYGRYMEVMDYKHHLDYAGKSEDYFEQCITHPILSPFDSSVTPCLFRRGYRNEWLICGDFSKNSLLDIIHSQRYKNTMGEQDLRINSAGPKRCPRCRKTINNIFLDILKRATDIERLIMRFNILSYFPRTPMSELNKYYQ